MVGTSGYSYPNWQDEFYPRDISKKDWLSYYSGQFDSVEINNSFYRLPARSSFESWAEKTPPGFIFSVKASRYITHMKKLNQVQEPLEKFINSARGLKNKLGPILFQLPANFGQNNPRLTELLKLSGDLKFVFEFRHKSWFSRDTYNLLDKYGCGLVISSSPGFPSQEVVTGGICYIRLHGEKKLYHSSYSQKQLRDYADKIADYSQQGIDSYAYFNNDALGHAFRNAIALKQLLK